MISYVAYNQQIKSAVKLEADEKDLERIKERIGSKVKKECKL